MKFLDLFAGIGGFRLGMEQAGHECVGYVEWDKFARKSYEAIHNTEGEWTWHDISTIDYRDIPRADCWTFGFPCQDISVAGEQKGFSGNRSSLFFAVTKRLRQIKEWDSEKMPTYLLIENVKNFLSVNRGWDFLEAQIELDEIGYNLEWQVLNSSDFGVPQNRERVFIVGHLRGTSRREIFPITTTSRTFNNVVNVGNVNPSGHGMNGNVYSNEGISPTLTTNKGEGLKIIQPVLTPNRMEKRQNGRRFKEDGEPMFTLTAQDRHGIAIREATKKGYDIANEGDSINLAVPGSQTRRGRVGKGVANTLDTGCQQGVVVWDMYNKVQRSDGNVGTLTTKGNTSSTNSGTFGIDDGIRIRKLTPRECWRLQGFPDWAFERAQAVNSDSQLYKQAGNSVTVNVIAAIAKRL
ncbi:DNA cytosine methyltransferase [Solibacillus cecembensis]|uniref:DNA cytosine methyltransferase n=1 Tax=Solibacillus cecembensis TaxID=459347 RepID=UPI003CFF7DE8